MDYQPFAYGRDMRKKRPGKSAGHRICEPEITAAIK
jgi:hypothetical protein